MSKIAGKYWAKAHPVQCDVAVFANRGCDFIKRISYGNDRTTSAESACSHEMYLESK